MHKHLGLRSLFVTIFLTVIIIQVLTYFITNYSINCPKLLYIKILALIGYLTTYCPIPKETNKL